MDREEDPCEHYYFSQLRAQQFSPERRTIHGFDVDTSSPRKRRRERVCGTCLARLTELGPYLRCCFRPEICRDSDTQQRRIRSSVSPRGTSLEEMEEILRTHAPDTRDLISAQELLYGGILPLWRYAKSEFESGVETRVLYAPEIEDGSEFSRTIKRAVESLTSVLMQLEDDSNLESRIAMLCRIEPDFPTRRKDRPWIRNKLDCCLSRMEDAAKLLAENYYCADEPDAPGAVWMGGIHIAPGTKVSVIRPRLMFPDCPLHSPEHLRTWIVMCACIKWGVKIRRADLRELEACRAKRDALSERVLILQISDMGTETESSVWA